MSGSLQLFSCHAPSDTKLVPPTQCITYLGVEISSLTMTLSLPADKLSAFRAVITEFLGRKRASKWKLQYLAGKLNWAYQTGIWGPHFRALHSGSHKHFPTPCIVLLSDNRIPQGSGMVS